MKILEDSNVLAGTQVLDLERLKILTLMFSNYVLFGSYQSLFLKIEL